MNVPRPVPTVRKMDWRSAPVHVAVVALVLLAVWRVMPNPQLPAVLAVTGLSYLGISRGVRAVLLRDFRAGARLLRNGQFAEAAQHFQKSYEFLSKHPRLDRWRFLFLLDSSAYSYREMALCNIGFAHTQLGDGEEAIRWYKRAAGEYSGSPLALAALHFAEAFDQTQPSHSGGAA